jgi:hypothetical protein
MSAVAELEQLDITREPGYSLHLVHRPVFIVLTLDGEDRALDPRHASFDVPRAKLRIEPYLGPAGEDGVGVAMMTSKLFRQVVGQVRLAPRSDAAQCEILDDDVGRHRDHSGH